MTIDEAIDKLQNYPVGASPDEDIEFNQAVLLGIEALKTIKAERTIYGFKRQVRLPGETEEEERR